MTVLDQSKTLAESALQMLYAAKEGGGNPKVGLLCVTKGLLETDEGRGWVDERRGEGRWGRKTQKLCTVWLRHMFTEKMPLVGLLRSVRGQWKHMSKDTSHACSVLRGPTLLANTDALLEKRTG